MNEFTKIILGNYEPLERKGKIFIYGIEERVNSSIDFIKKKYKHYNEFKIAIDYIEYCHANTVKADLKSLSKLGFYPATETQMELDYSIKHALIGSYKASFSDLRRALELSIVFVYLSSEIVERKKAIDWIMSRSDTPHFSNVLNKLIEQKRYKDINKTCNWERNLKNLYWKLSDFSHNKGELKGYRELNNPNFFVGGATSAPSIKYETLELFCDFYIKTVKEIVAIQALYNPIILVGVPLDEKFGLEGPMSGFLNEGQAKLVNKLIPLKYRTYFDQLVENDEEIRSIVEFFDSLPDLSEDDLKEQVERQKEFLERMGKKNTGI